MVCVNEDRRLSRLQRLDLAPIQIVIDLHKTYFLTLLLTRVSKFAIPNYMQDAHEICNDPQSLISSVA
jgi:hypothetical protein